MQKWKIDSSLHSCERKNGKKIIDYHSTYVDEFLNSDPIRDWESIDRCAALWEWCMRKIGDDEGLYSEFIETRALKWKVLDCGTKDGQFPQRLKEMKIEDVIGIEISPDYVEYAQELKRPIIYGDVCDMKAEWRDKFDCVFSHHLLGLTFDIQKALDEMYRVLKSGGYMITCTDVPGNPRKHYSLINDPKIFTKFITNNDMNVLYNGFWNHEFPKEWVFFVRKL